MIQRATLAGAQFRSRLRFTAFRSILFVLFVLSHGTALATPRRKAAVPLGNDAGVVHAINGNVYQVLTGGWWCNADREGPYRFIVYSNGKSQTEHNLYLQLLAADHGRTQVDVVKTVPVIETANASLFFQDLKLVSGGRCSSVVLKGNLQHRIDSEDRLERFELKAFQNGDYLATFESEIPVTPTPRSTRTPTR